MLAKHLGPRQRELCDPRALPGAGLGGGGKGNQAEVVKAQTPHHLPVRQDQKRAPLLSTRAAADCLRHGPETSASRNAFQGGWKSGKREFTQAVVFHQVFKHIGLEEMDVSGITTDMLNQRSARDEREVIVPYLCLPHPKQTRQDCAQACAQAVGSGRQRVRADERQRQSSAHQVLRAAQSAALRLCRP